jgi:hypothetical protein
VPLLERIGTKDAQEVLEMIGKGPAAAAGTKAAKSARERLARRPPQ